MNMYHFENQVNGVFVVVSRFVINIDIFLCLINITHLLPQLPQLPKRPMRLQSIIQSKLLPFESNERILLIEEKNGWHDG